MIIKTWLIAIFIFPASVWAGSMSVIVLDQNEQPVLNAVVKFIPQNHKPKIVPEDSFIDQINKEYVPSVVLVIKGANVSFPNKDNIKHHVYSFSEAKHFELPLYEGTPAKPVNFDKAGVVSLGCNIHDWMRGYIYVSDSPYAKLTDANGKVEFNDLPLDSYSMEIWHPQSKEIVSEREFVITDISNLNHIETIYLKPLIKIRRNKSKKRSRYR